MHSKAIERNTRYNAKGERGGGRQIQNLRNKANPSIRLNLNQASYQTHSQKHAGEPADFIRIIKAMSLVMFRIFAIDANFLRRSIESAYWLTQG